MNVKYTAHAIFKIYVKCGTFIILNCLIMLELNNLFNICVLNDLYVLYTLRNADIVLICVNMYNIYTVFLLLFITVFTVLFYIVTLTIIFIYYQFYLLGTNKDYYYCSKCITICCQD